MDDHAKDEVLRQLEREARDPVTRRLEQLEAELVELRGSRQRQIGRSVALSVLISACVIAASATAQDLTRFGAGTPARADEVNGNFALLKAWIERKVGDVDTACTDASCGVSVRGNVTSTATIQGAALTSTGSVTGTSVTATGAVQGASVTSTGELTAGGWLRVNGTDVAFGSTSGRGDGGSAMVHGGSDTLMLNYSGQLSGGTEIQSDLRVSGGLSIGGTSLRDHIRSYVRSSCRIRIGWRDSCHSTCNSGPQRSSPWQRPDGTCSDTDSDGTTQCIDGFTGINIDGDTNGDDNFFVDFECD